MTWTQAQQEALARANTASFLKWGLELRHSLFPSPVRMVNHDIDVSVPLEATAPIDGGTSQNFVGTAFRFTEPDLTGQPDPTVQVEIDGVSGTFQPFLRPAMASGEPILLTLRGFMYDTRARVVVQMLRVFHLQMRTATTSMTTVSATFGYTNAANQPFPKEKYDASTNPGLV